MYTKRLLLALVAAGALFSAGCAADYPPPDQQEFQLSVRNPLGDPMNVTVHHVGGVTTLGVIASNKTKEYKIKLNQAQNVAVVATKKDGFGILRQNVFLDPGRVTHITLQNTATTAPVADQ